MYIERLGTELIFTVFGLYFSKFYFNNICFFKIFGLLLNEIINGLMYNIIAFG